jgi:aspartyl-tRNA(Asn)/glutamyl-tRNA(Gln) amidotransferase subunit A
LVGGSSSGSSFSVAKKITSFALGNDTGDSVRRPASYCGVVGFKPSYGLVSRYGMIPMSSSLDTVGIIANGVELTKKIFSILAKKDHRDLLTITRKPEYKFNSSKKVAIIEGLDEYLSPEIRDDYQKIKNLIKDLGYEVREVKMPETIKDNLLSTYVIICCSELVSHLNALKGVTFGPGDNRSIPQKRSDLLGEIVKERLLIGSYLLEEKEMIRKAGKL